NKTGKKAFRQGVDGASAGFCSCGGDGSLLFINGAMRKVLDAAFTGDIRYEDIPSSVLREGCRTEDDGDRTFLILPDRTVWGVYKKETDGGAGYAAFDQTELYGKRLELQKRRAHLSAVGEKIRQYNRSLDAVIRDRELLDAKIKIHDDVGRALLSLRSYLNREVKDRGSLVNLWRVTVSILRRETAADVSDDRMETLSEAARAVDVTLHLDGEIPNDTIIREISAAAIRECLTNTVKHAEGNNVYINARTDGGVYTVRIKNDGKKPDKPIEETGGLHTLRSSVERYGGEMTVLWEDGFELILTLGYTGRG
ncbi:MAG: hypothetical protein J5879_09295, partial [Clostridia bacterium]|nr:hypothetical protein [Clostridia bacterium]